VTHALVNDREALKPDTKGVVALLSKFELE